MEELKIEDLRFSHSGNFIEVANEFDRHILDVSDAQNLVEFLNKYIEDARVNRESKRV